MKISIKGILLLSFIIVSLTTYGQNEVQIDSLKSILEKNTSDSLKFNSLLELSKFQILADSSSGIKTSNEAYKLAKDKLSKKQEAIALLNIANTYRAIKNPMAALSYLRKAYSILTLHIYLEELATCYFFFGRIYYDMNNISVSIDYHKKALKVNEERLDTLAIATSLNALGLMYWRGGEFDKSEKYYLKAIVVREKIKDLKGISIGYNNLGSLHWGLGNYSKSFNYFIEALSIVKKTDNKRRIVLITNNIGLIYQEWGDYKNALKQHKEAANISLEINYVFGLAYSYVNIGSCYQAQKNYNEAIAFFEKARLNYTLEKKTIGVALALRHIGETYYKTKEYEKSIKYLQNSLKEASKVNSLHHISIAYKALSKTFFAFEKYNIAKIKAEKALEIATKNNYKEVIQQSAFLLSDYYSLTNNYKSSLKYFKMATSIKDSIFNEDKTKQISEMQTKYETDKKIVLIELQKSDLANKNAEIKEKNNMERTLIIGLFSLIIIALLIIIGYVRKQRDNTKISLQKEELEKANNKLIELSQFKETLTGMIVHDLKNPLNLISNITSIPEIKEPVTRMHTLVLNILDIQKFENSKMNMLIEKEYLSKVLNLAFSQVHFLVKRKNILFTSLISDKLIVLADTDKLERVLVNLLHNASKYTPNNGKITLRTEPIDEDHIKLTITNNGKKIPADEIDNIFMKFGQYKPKKGGQSVSTGLGLTFCKMAMNAMNQEIGVESNSVNTSFWISLKTFSLSNFKVENTIQNKREELMKFNSVEKEIVLRFAEHIKENEIYEISKIKHILAKAKSTEYTKVTNWAILVENSALAMNDKLYNELCDIK